MQEPSKLEAEYYGALQHLHNFPRPFLDQAFVLKDLLGSSIKPLLQLGG
jgi:hypothetical protein